MTRERLPDRRPAETVLLEYGGTPFMMTVGFYPDERPGEVITHGARSGSNLDAVLADACVVVCSLIHYGVEPRPIAASMAGSAMLSPPRSLEWSSNWSPPRRQPGNSSSRRQVHDRRTDASKRGQHSGRAGRGYGDAATSMAALAKCGSITLGHPFTLAQVVLCMIDLKLARLAGIPVISTSRATGPRLGEVD